MIRLYDQDVRSCDEELCALQAELEDLRRPLGAPKELLKEQLRAKIASATEALRALEALEEPPAAPRSRSEGPKARKRSSGGRVSFGAEPEPELFTPERREERLGAGVPRS